MKKVMAIIFSIVVAISSVMLTTTTTATAVGNTTLLGDANQDGKLDTTDAIYILYYIALVCAGYPKDDVYSRFDVEIDERVFDVDRSEKVDTTDVLYLLTYIAKCGAGQDATWPPAPEKIYSDDILVFNPVKGVETWNLRSAPSLEAGVVTKMSAGENCKVIKILQESWYEVEYFGIDLYLQITPDSESFFYVDPIPRETASTTTETTTTTTETTTQSTETSIETTKATTLTTTEFSTTKATTESTTITANTTAMESKTTSTTTETKPTTTKATTKTTTKSTTSDSSTTTSTKLTTTSTTTTEELQLGDIVTPTEKVKLTNSDGEITVDAGEFITIVSEKNGNYVVIYQKQLYEMNTTAYLNKVEHEYQEKQILTVEEIETGDILKFTGETWYIRDESESAVGTLKENELFVVMARNGNILTIITSDGTIGNIFCIADKYCMMVD
ncbi:dockerin type I domain-containing protein [Megamonas funiformis]|uniref:dockerin type I domain-containing protein n=1 Tax=Megamonas funiformis TaxID=437897 RepID=UPI003F7DBB35